MTLRGGLAAVTAVVVVFMGMAAASAGANVLAGETGFCVAGAGGYVDDACTQPATAGGGSYRWVPAAGTVLKADAMGKKGRIDSDFSELSCKGEIGVVAGSIAFTGATGLEADLSFVRCMYGEEGCGVGAHDGHGGSVDANVDGDLEATGAGKVDLVVPSFSLVVECDASNNGVMAEDEPASFTIGKVNEPIEPDAIGAGKFQFQSNVSEDVTLEPEDLYAESPFELRTHPPAVTGLSSSHGNPPGGETVTITGVNFEEVSGVSFGTAPAASYEVLSPTTIEAVAPSGVGNVNVSVSTPAGTSRPFPENEYSYGPVVSGVSPDYGSPKGGTSVTISGVNLLGATSVDFGGKPAASFEVTSPGTIVAVTPNSGGYGGRLDVTVTTPGGTSPTGQADGFTYPWPPELKGVSVRKGPSTGGTIVVIAGGPFVGVEKVEFGGVPASSFEVLSESSISAVSPAHVPGSAYVTVTTVSGTTPTNKKYEFKFGKPEVTHISPSSGPLAGGTEVTVEGGGFQAGSADFKFGKVSAEGTCVSASLCTVVAPAQTKPGTVDVIAIFGKEKSKKVSADRFDYE